MNESLSRFILSALVVSVHVDVHCSFVLSPLTGVTVITYQWPNSWTGPASQLKSEPKQMLYFVKIWRIPGTGG